VTTFCRSNYRTVLVGLFDISAVYLCLASSTRSTVSTLETRKYQTHISSMRYEFPYSLIQSVSNRSLLTKTLLTTFQPLHLWSKHNNCAPVQQQLVELLNIVTSVAPRSERDATLACRCAFQLSNGLWAKTFNLWCHLPIHPVHLRTSCRHIWTVYYYAASQYNT